MALLRLSVLKATTPSNIHAGFRVSDIVPVNVNIFTDDEFLPSDKIDRPLPQTNKTEEATRQQMALSEEI